jgi:TP901 family phage tail tape measure protein
MFDYSVKFEAIDKISATINNINSKMSEMKDKASQASTGMSGAINKTTQSAKTLQDNLTKVNSKLTEVGDKGKALAGKGIQGLVGGVALLAPLGKALQAYQDISRAKGEIASLGIDDAGIKSISKSAMEFSNTWAGTTTADFIRASYDIKSGIASLSNADVGKFTALAGMTAVATKASTAEMTKLFALGHGIFREQFTSDVQFGEQFSSAISTAVQAFRTDGADLVSGLSTLGASATAMGVSLEEQLAILGMSKGAFNSASEGATSYRAFLTGAVKAQEKLGLSFVDSSGKLLPMADIMDKIKEKVASSGKTMQDAGIQKALGEAFGSAEATKMISALINKTDELRSSQALMKKNMLEGTKVTQEMALAMQQGKEFELLTQKIQNVSAVIGGLFAPYAIKIAGYIGEVTASVQAWVEKNPELTATIVKWAGIIGGVLAVLGALSIVLGVIGMAVGSLSTIMTVFSTVLKVVQIATLLFNMALWANPIVWIVAGVVALIVAVGALIYYFEDITTWVGNLWDKFTGFIASLNLVENALNGVKSYFMMLTAPIRYVIDLIDSFMSKFDIYNKAKAKVEDMAGAVQDKVASAWEDTKSFFGAGSDKKATDAPIDNVNKNHTIVDVNVVATGAVATDQKAKSTGGRVKLNTASNGV